MSDRSALLAVQGAIYQQLTGDDDLMDLAPVYDQVPGTTKYPYCEIAELIETPDNTEGQQGRTVMVTIFAFSQVPGFMVLHNILDNLMRLLDEDSISKMSPDAGWSIWSSEFARSEMVKLPDGITRQLGLQVKVGVTRDQLGE